VADTPDDLRLGRIVWANVRDRRGIQKQRPLIVLTRTAEIYPDEPLVALAITTTFTDPPPPDHVPLPWHPQGRVITKLRKRSAAVLSWVVEIHPQDVRQIGGDVPIRLMIELLQRLDLEH
jgi:hypothetical protein